MSRFWIGEALRVDVTFTDAIGAAVPATGVAAAYRRIGGSVINVSAGNINNPSTGVFEVSLTPSDAGDYWIRITSTAPTPAAVEVPFTVAASNVT